MRGGVVLFRGIGADAMRYVESDRSRADDYYASDAASITYTTLDSTEATMGRRALRTDEYARWVDWINPDTGEQMGMPRLTGADRLGSPRFAEMVINTPKSLSIAAALHPEVSEALDAAQQDALAEIQRWVARHSVTRVGPRGKQELVPIEHLQVVGITHRTSRAGDPHRHIHMQIGTRVWAAGKWRALDTAATFKQQGAIRALGTAVIAASPHLATVLDRYGLTLDPVTGEVTELSRFNDLMSKRGAQVRKNLEHLEAEWEASHPGESIGPVIWSRLTAKAWALNRPAKKPTSMRDEAAWIVELREAGYDATTLERHPLSTATQADDLSVQGIASRALDRCAAKASAWTRHDVQEHTTRIITEHGVRATPEQVRELVEVTTALALEDCFSVLPSGAAAPEHVAHLTSWRVVEIETRLRDLLAGYASAHEAHSIDIQRIAARLGQELDADQVRAATAVASTDPLVIVEGAAGAGKTTMLAAAIAAAKERGSTVQVFAPTKRAAEVAHEELGVAATSVAALVHAYGFRWNDDGVWTRLNPRDIDPHNGLTFTGPPPDMWRQGDRIVIDEAGMLDQDSALALFTVANEVGATVALVGDRAQLAAVGRGGVLDMAAQIAGRTVNMAEVHRFTDPGYAKLTIQIRDRRDPGIVFDELDRLGLIHLHSDSDDVRDYLVRQAKAGETITVASNDDAAELNERIRTERIARNLVDDSTTTTGRDGLTIGAGDLIQTRRNDTTLGVANRQQWIVQRVEADGSAWIREARGGRKHTQKRHLPANYIREHAHLSYASTAYGVQGVTAPASHTVLSDGVDGAAVYVGMTRGRGANALHVVAGSTAEARAQFIDAMNRDAADRGLADATERAATSVRGLVADGPVALVNSERTRLRARIAAAEAQLNQWENVLSMIREQAARHQVERDEMSQRVAVAERRAEIVRGDVLAPLIDQAKADGTAYLLMRERAFEAARARSDAERLHHRSAARAFSAASDALHKAEATVLSRWDHLPQNIHSLDDWATEVTRHRAKTTPTVVEAEQHLDRALSMQKDLARSHSQEQMLLHRRVPGSTPPSVLSRSAARLRQQTERNHADLAHLESLPIAEAAEFAGELARQIEGKPVNADQVKTAWGVRGRRSPGRGQQRGSGRSL